MFESINALFNNAALRKILVRYRIVLGIALVALLFWQLGWRAENFWLAFAVSMVGEFIQLWCFASLDKNATLAFRGPYSLVRNPMYLGRYFIILGLLLLLDSGRLAVDHRVYRDLLVLHDESGQARRGTAERGVRPKLCGLLRGGAALPAAPDALQQRHPCHLG